MASALHWIPDKLYNYCITAVGANYYLFQRELRTFHCDLLFDVHYKLYKEGRLFQLGTEFEDLSVFEKVLKVKDKRHLLHNCFQALMNYGSQIASKLAEKYRVRCTDVCISSLTEDKKLIEFGFGLGNFLMDAGWFLESEIVFKSLLELCYSCKGSERFKKPQDSDSKTNIYPIILECYVRLLRAQNIYCKFKDAQETFYEAQACIETIKQLELDVNFASIYGEFSVLNFGQNNYQEAYEWSLEALSELDSSMYPREIIHVLRASTKASIVKRELKRAGMLIKQALHLTREQFGQRNLVMADTLLVYGFYLLHVDAISHSVNVYQNALDLRASILGGKNILVAMAHEDLAYALYVYEYSSGHFNNSRDHVDKALQIKANLLNADHLLWASPKRVKALIIEEIALDSNDKVVQQCLFYEAEDLHLCALHLVQEYFGEMNVLTARHYANLGRLYQSMKKYKDSQALQLRAIAIKEALLGPDDHEVAVSMAHLASLYTYDMELYAEAEVLFWKSINIGLKLFGKGYSGLEYDYRGLLRIYGVQHDTEKVFKVHSIMHNWKLLRDKTIEVEKEFCPWTVEVDPVAPEDILANLNSMD
ncbi:Amyloid protein-binding protein 2, partial [Stegodyphus mimosarum]